MRLRFVAYRIYIYTVVVCFFFCIFFCFYFGFLFLLFACEPALPTQLSNYQMQKESIKISLTFFFRYFAEAIFYSYSSQRFFSYLLGGIWLEQLWHALLYTTWDARSFDSVWGCVCVCVCKEMQIRTIGCFSGTLTLNLCVINIQTICRYNFWWNIKLIKYFFFHYVWHSYIIHFI